VADISRSIQFYRDGLGFPTSSTLAIGDMLKGQGYRTGIFGKWHVGLAWLDKDGKRIRGGVKTSPFIDYEKRTPLVDGPNERGFDESFITPNCPTTGPLTVLPEPVHIDHQ